MRAFANGDHGAATHSLLEQCSHGGSDRMTVTVRPHPAHRKDPVAAVPCSALASAAADLVTSIVDPFGLA